jgi:hypothetical protein
VGFSPPFPYPRPVRQKVGDDDYRLTGVQPEGIRQVLVIGAVLVHLLVHLGTDGS